MQYQDKIAEVRLLNRQSTGEMRFRLVKRSTPKNAVPAFIRFKKAIVAWSGIEIKNSKSVLFFTRRAT